MAKSGTYLLLGRERQLEEPSTQIPPSRAHVETAALGALAERVAPLSPNFAWSFLAGRGICISLGTLVALLLTRMFSRQSCRILMGALAKGSAHAAGQRYARLSILVPQPVRCR